jgi:hypothetical protein
MKTACSLVGITLPAASPSSLNATAVFSRCRMCRIDATVRQVVPVFTQVLLLRNWSYSIFRGNAGYKRLSHGAGVACGVARHCTTALGTPRHVTQRDM